MFTTYAETAGRTRRVPGGSARSDREKTNRKRVFDCARGRFFFGRDFDVRRRNRRRDAERERRTNDENGTGRKYDVASPLAENRAGNGLSSSRHVLSSGISRHAGKKAYRSCRTHGSIFKRVRTTLKSHRTSRLNSRAVLSFPKVSTFSTRFHIQFEFNIFNRSSLHGPRSESKPVGLRGRRVRSRWRYFVTDIHAGRRVERNPLARAQTTVGSARRDVRIEKKMPVVLLEIRLRYRRY